MNIFQQTEFQKAKFVSVFFVLDPYYTKVTLNSTYQVGKLSYKMFVDAKGPLREAESFKLKEGGGKSWLI